MVDRQALAGFIAALVHDVRKLDLNDQGSWIGEHHEDLTRTVNSFLRPGEVDFLHLFGSEVMEIIAAHHNTFKEIRVESLEEARPLLKQVIERDPFGRAKISLALADRWQKAMYGAVEDGETRGEFNKTLRNPLFQPYWGESRLWEPGLAAVRLREAAARLSEGKGRSPEGYPARLNLRRLLEVQEHFRGFPHTTYIPHSPLSVHHRFTAVLYLFIYSRLAELDSPLDLKGLDFSLLRITPDPLALLYRLRDVSIAREGMKRLRRELAHRLHAAYRSLVPDLSPVANPFEFFGGDDLVWITEQAGEVIAILKEFVDADSEVRSLRMERLDYDLPDGWQIKNGRLNFYARAEEVEARLETYSLVGEGLTNFAPAVTVRCQRCGRPAPEPEQGIGGELLCPACAQLRDKARGRLDLQRLAGGDLVGFVFLTLPDALRPHARQVAEDELIPAFANRRGVMPGLIQPSPFGFFEYLAALDDLGHMQAALGQVLIRNVKEGRAAALFASSTQMAWVLRWDECWPFIGRVNAERGRLALSRCLTVVFCRPDFPFWGLMDRYARYREGGGDWYFDAAGRSIVMFTEAEVNDIRRLAVDARKAEVSNAELEGLVQTALLTGPHELHLEIEARATDRKLGERQGFPGRLRAALDRLDYGGLNPQQQRQKRAVFIKYIKKLKGGR